MKMMFEEAAIVDEIQQLLAVSSDEKKRKRRILNRESARRLRWRKRMHFEKLNEQAAVLAVENRELKKQLFMVTRRYQLVRTETNRLLSESILLKQQLAVLSQFLLAGRRHPPPPLMISIPTLALQ